LFEGEEPIFEAMGVEPEISKILERRIYLKSGGYIVIDYGEALTAIDVNTGRYLGKKDLEDTILRTNLEAAREIAYQIRLKNLGGIIIVDFIDMERKESKELVYQTLCEALRRDRIKTYVYPISELGLVQITRKRTRNDVVRSMTEQCTHCDGSGLRSSRYVECYKILRSIKYACRKERAREVDLYVSKDIAQVLFEEERSALEWLEKTYKKRINVIVRHDLGLREYRVEVRE
jgi:ribonuclease G